MGTVGENELRGYIRQHLALALVPVEQVVDVLDHIHQQRLLMDDADGERLVAFD